MNAPTDLRLKQALAKMLPDEVCIRYSKLFWGENSFEGELPAVLDTELLHLCWLVEQTLTGYQVDEYFLALHNERRVNSSELFFTCHATWQQRVAALAKVKGIEI